VDGFRGEMDVLTDEDLGNDPSLRGHPPASLA
jgi:hypothetical protein